MKRKIILSLITICVLSFASCGKQETTATTESTMESTEATSELESALQQDASMETFNYKLGNYDSGMDTTTEETGTVEESTDSTSSIDSTGVDSKIDAGDYVEQTTTSSQNSSDEKAYASIADIPKDIYDPDSNLSVTEQLEKLEEPYSKGLITDEQLDTIADQLFNKGNSGSSTSGSTGANGDTYIPAHGNPGTVMSNEDTGYEGRIEDAPDVSGSRLY